MAKQKDVRTVKVEAKNYTPSSQIIELIRLASTNNYILFDPATQKKASELELFKDTKYKSDENKDFKDERVFSSLEFRIIAENEGLVLFDLVKIFAVSDAVPLLTETGSQEVQLPFDGTSKELREELQKAIFPYLVLNVKTGSGDTFKNDLASIGTDAIAKLRQKAEGDTFKAMLVVDPAIVELDLSKFRIFEGSKAGFAPDGKYASSVSSLGYDLTKDITWKIQAKFRGYELDFKGMAEVEK